MAFNTGGNKSLENILPELNENGEKRWVDADRFLEAQVFIINNEDTLLHSKNGAIISIPKNAFLDENGNTVEGPFEIELKEALKPSDILKAGLQTKSGNDLLETGGMFYINARKNGKQLKFNPQEPIVVDVPTNEFKKGMQAYTGFRTDSETIDWQNPKPIVNPLHPTEITDLDFYPPNYLDTLHSLGKNAKNKTYTDSLYYSFAAGFSNQEVKKIDTNELEGESIEDLFSITSKDQQKVMLSLIKNRVLEQINSRYLDKVKFDVFMNKKTENDKEETFEITIKVKINDGFQLCYVDYAPLVWDLENNYVDLYKTPEFYTSIKNKLLTYSLYSTSLKDLPRVLEQKAAYKNVFMILFPEISQPNKSVAVYYNLLSITGKEHIYNDYFELKQQVVMKKNSKTPSCGIVSLNIAVVAENQNINPKEYDKIELFLSPSLEIKGLNPSKIKTIWNKEFNNTLLATREFEERVPCIHETCDGNVLDVYVNNLDKNMWEIDEMATKYLEGQGKYTLFHVFNEFANQKHGKIELNKKAVTKLNNYYKKQQELIQKAIEKTNASYYNKLAKLTYKAREKEMQQISAEFKRENGNYQKEYNDNLTSVCKQLGVKKNGPISEDAYRILINDPGWINIDRIVAEQTKKRETIDITDSTTGKRAVIRYEKLEIEISNAKNYDRIYAYLLPEELNSFQRMPQNGNVFTENLNELYSYNWCVVAYKGSETFWFNGGKAKKGRVSNVALSSIIERELNKAIDKMQKQEHKAELLRDINFHAFEYEEQLRQEKLKSEQKFREKIQKTILPCIASVEEKV